MSKFQIFLGENLATWSRMEKMEKNECDSGAKFMGGYNCKHSRGLKYMYVKMALNMANIFSILVTSKNMVFKIP